MSNVTLNKNALTVPSIVFNDGVLSSNAAGNLTWNGEEYHPSGNTGNVFTEYVTFNGGMISNGDIILNGSKLLLANGASVELYTGEGVPLPEGGVPNPGPGTDNSGESIDTSNFATLDGDNNFTGTLTVGGEEVITKNTLTNLNTDIYWTTESNRPSSVLGFNGSANGSYIAFNSKNHTSYPGSFSIITGNNSDESSFSLTGKPDGTLTWGGKNIVRTQTPIKEPIYTNTGERSVISYNDGTESGACIYLFGKSNTTFKGGFVIRAYATDDTYKDLRGYSDGTLMWNGKNVATINDVNSKKGYVDYTTGVYAWGNVTGYIGDTSNIKYFTAPYDCFAILQLQFKNSPASFDVYGIKISVNDINIAYPMYQNGSGLAIVVPLYLKSGDKLGVDARYVTGSFTKMSSLCYYKWN